MCGVHLQTHERALPSALDPFLEVAAVFVDGVFDGPGSSVAEAVDHFQASQALVAVNFIPRALASRSAASRWMSRSPARKRDMTAGDILACSAISSTECELCRIALRRASLMELFAETAGGNSTLIACRRLSSLAMSSCVSGRSRNRRSILRLMAQPIKTVQERRKR